MLMRSRLWTLAALLIVPTMVKAAEPVVIPTPKKLTLLDGRIEIASKDRKPRACLVVVRPQAAPLRAAVEDINASLSNLGAAELPVVGTAEAAQPINVWIVLATYSDLDALEGLPEIQKAIPAESTLAEAARPDGYILRVAESDQKQIVLCLGHDDRACYYAAQTLIQLFTSSDTLAVEMPRVEIVDWPTYRIRLVKNDASMARRESLERFARVLPQYKINVYALQYHEEEDGTWRKPSARYVENIESVGKIARERGTFDPAMYLCPFLEPRLDLTIQSDVEEYVDRFRWAIRQGYKWLEIDINDWGKWRNVSEAERARFGEMGSYMAHLTTAVHAAVRSEFPEVRMLVCSNNQFYKEPPRPEMISLCKGIPEDVLVYWTGPRSRSRVITAGEIEDWTSKTGRKPFLWDNTIYAHYQPYWVGYVLNAYGNTFPDDMHERLAGPGIHLNCSSHPLYLPGIITFADFLWNPEAYDPERSLRVALERLWGPDAPTAAGQVRQRLVALAKYLYEARRGWITYDGQAAREMLDGLEEAAAKFSAIAGDEALSESLEAKIVRPMRPMVEEFQPSKRRVPRLRQAIEHPDWPGTINPSVEEVVDGTPRGWSFLRGAGRGELRLSEDAHSGKQSLCLAATVWRQKADHPRKYISVRLVHGSEDGGREGHDAYYVEGDKGFRLTFYLKGNVPTVNLKPMGWEAEEGREARHGLRIYPTTIKPTEEWRQYTAIFYTKSETARCVVMFGIVGYEDEGTGLGEFYVDDVKIEPLEGKQGEVQ